MLSRFMEVERVRDGAAAAPGLSNSEVIALKNRILFDDPKVVLQIASQRKPARRIFWLSGGIAAVMLLGFGMHIFLGGGKVTEPKVSLVLGQVQKNKSPLLAGTAITPGEELNTGKESILLINQDQKIKTVISQNSQVQIQKISGAGSKPAVEIIQNKGIIFLSVQSGAAEATIRTSAAQVRVVGTQFSVTTTEQGTSVAVLEGTVRVKPDNAIASGLTDPKFRQKALEETPVKAGQRVIVSGQSRSVVLQSLSVQENKYLLSLAALLEVGHDPAKNQAIKKLSNAIFHHELSYQTPPRLTLAEIKKKYGKISRIGLSNGRTYIGFFTMQGDQIQIITTNGIVRQPGAMLKEVKDAE